MILQVFLPQSTVAIRASLQPKARRRKLALTVALVYDRGQILIPELEDRTILLEATQLNSRQFKTTVAKCKQCFDHEGVYNRNFPSRHQKRPHFEASPSNKFHAVLLLHVLYVPCY
jgi:hypothetical protein